MSRSILLVDDDRGFSSLAQAALAREGHPVVLARSLHEAREAVERAAPELVVLDRRLPDGDGLDYLPELKAQLPGTPVVMVTAHGDIQSAVDAIRAGASDYVAKPVDLTDLVMRAQRAMGEQTLRERCPKNVKIEFARHGLVPHGRRDAPGDADAGSDRHLTAEPGVPARAHRGGQGGAGPARPRARGR
jgi:DNA-binding NtrC family response regulator